MFARAATFFNYRCIDSSCNPRNFPSQDYYLMYDCDFFFFFLSLCVLAASETGDSLIL